MKTTILYILLVFLLISCQAEIDEPNYTIANLQGDWIGNEFEDRLIIKEDSMIIHHIGLCFFYEKFELDANVVILDSMRFRAFPETRTDLVRCRYKIDYLSEDSLVLINEYDKDYELRLSKLKPKYDYGFKQIKIKSSPCHGSCPVFHLEILNDGNFTYKVFHNTSKSGGFRGVLNDENLIDLRNQINTVDWKSFPDKDWSAGSGAQYFTIELIAENDSIYTFVNNSSKVKAFKIFLFKTFWLIENAPSIKTKTFREILEED